MSQACIKHGFQLYVASSTLHDIRDVPEITKPEIGGKQFSSFF
jgi:hypothetical protein